MDSIGDLLQSSGLSAPASSAGGNSVPSGGVASLLSGSGLTAPSSTGSVANAVASLPGPQTASYKDVPGLDLTQTGVPNQTPAQITNQYGTSSTISQAPKQGFWGKVGSFFGKVGDLLDGETSDSSIQEQNARNAIVQSTTSSINNQPYLAIAKQLGIDQAVTPTLPAGVDPSKITPNVMQYYKDQAAANVVKNNFSTLQKQFPDLEDPSKDAVTPDQVNQQLGTDPSTLLGKTETMSGILGAAALAIGTGGIGDILTAMTGAGTAETGALPMLTTLAKNVGIFTALDKVTTPLRNMIVQKGNVGDGGQALLYVAQQAANILGTAGADAGLDKLTDLFAKHTITSYALPQTFTISGADIQAAAAKAGAAGGEIAPGARFVPKSPILSSDEIDIMGKDLGWNQDQINAFKNGATVTTPSYKIITTADKPWWGKIKNFFGFEPTNDVNVTKTGGSMSGIGGEIGVGPEPITPEGLKALATKVSGGSDETGVTNPVSKSPLTPALTEIANKVTAASKATKGVDSLLKASGVQLSSNSSEIPNNSIPKELQPLAEEAKKSANVDDFVNNQTPLYHRTTANFDTFDLTKKSPTSLGLHFFNSPEAANNPTIVSRFGKNVIEAYPQGKIADIGRNPSPDVRAIANLRGKNLENALKAQGYIGFNLGGETVIFDPKNVLTKKQLTDFYEKATSKNSLQVDKNGKPIENNNHGNNSKISNKAVRAGLRQNSEGGRSDKGGSEKRVGNDNDIHAQETPLERYARENGSTDQNGPGLAQRTRILDEKPVAIDDDTPSILKSLGLSNPFIGNFTLAFEKGAVKNLWIHDLGGNEDEENVGGYEDTTGTLHINSGSLYHSSVADGSVVTHELSGHAWYESLSPEGRLAFYTELKANTDLLKSAWENTPDASHGSYWEKTINQIGLEIQDHLSTEVAHQIMDSVGLHSDPTISLDSFIERSLRLDDTIKAINENLKGRGVPAITLKAEDTWVIREHNAVVAENASKLPASDDSMIGRYIGDIQDGTLTYGEDGARALAYPGETDLTLKTLEKLKGRTTVSKQYISDLSNSSDLKQPERDILRTALEQYPDGAQIPVQQFADTVKEDLLKTSQAKEPVTAFRIKTTDLNQLRSRLDREQQSLDAAISNPEAHQMAYGNNPEKSIPAYKARIAEIKAQIENVKNPKFDTGDALSDARAALASVQARVGVPETNIGKMTKDLDIDKANLEFYNQNPKAVELAGKEAPKTLEKKIATGETKIKAAKKTLLDTVKKIPVSEDAPRGLEYPADIQQRAIALAQEREEILDNPLQGLIKYIATSGNAKGTLPEVTGQTPEEIKASDEYGKMKNKNALEYVARGDQINQEVLPFAHTYGEAPDPEQVRSDFEDYITQIADWKNNARELQKDQSNFVKEMKDEVRLTKMSQTSSERQAIEDQKKHFLAKRRAEFEAAQAKVNAEAAKAQDRRNKVAEEFTKEQKPVKFSTINPLKSQDPEVQKIWQKFNARMNEAKNVGLKYVGKIPEIDAMGTKAFDLYESGYLPQEKQIKDMFDKFFDYAGKNGFEGLHYIPQYLPHIYENPDMFESAVQKSLKEKGLTKEEIQRYLNGKKLNPDLTTKLKLNPFFSKERFFPTYAEAATYGLKPKFNKMSQLIEYYERQLLQTSAARGLVEDLSDSGKIEPEQTSPREWRHIKYGPEGLRGYTAPPILAQFLDNYFQGHADTGTLDRVVGNIAKAARFTQRLALSTGIPFTSIDPFAIGITIKEATRGNFKVLSSLVKSNSNDATIKSLQSDYKYIEMMARNGIDLRNIVGTTPENYETIKTKWGKLTEGVKKDPAKLSSYSPFFQVVGQGVTNVFGKKTFNNFIPLLNVQVFKGAYEAAVKGGLSDADAQKLAADQTKSVMGLMNNVGRSKLTNDYMSAMFFAPVYREAMVNVLLNTAKSTDPRSWKNPMYKFNRQLFAGMAIAFAAYALLNKKLNGYYMWDNPTGYGGDLRIPLANGNIVYVPFMPSFMTIPRLIFAGTEAAIEGDVAGAFHQFGGTLSEVVSTTLDVLTNENYYDEPIYKTTDSPEQKFSKITAYLGGEVTSPYVQALITKIENAKGPTPTPLYESVVNALQLPIKFSTENKEQTNDIFNAIAAQSAATAANSSEAKSEAASLTQLAKTSGNAAAAAQYDALEKSNPTLAKSVATILQAANAGKTSTDTELLELDVTNGDRAKFIYQEAMKLPPAQRNSYIDDLIKKKVVTSKVYAQIEYLIQNNGKP